MVVPFYDSKEEYDMTTKTELEVIGEIRECQSEMRVDIAEIKAVLVGIRNTQNGGLVKRVNEQEERIGKLTTRVWLVVVALAGSGVISWGAIAAIIKNIGG